MQVKNTIYVTLKSSGHLFGGGSDRHANDNPLVWVAAMQRYVVCIGKYVVILDPIIIFRKSITNRFNDNVGANMWFGPALIWNYAINDQDGGCGDGVWTAACGFDAGQLTYQQCQDSEYEVAMDTIKITCGCGRETRCLTIDPVIYKISDDITLKVKITKDSSDEYIN